MALKLSFLYGITLRSWAKLLWENSFDVDVSCLGNAALITAMSAVNSALALADRTVRLPAERGQPPLFILGHWRSGTTHLHYLLNQDPQLITASTYQMSNPTGFLRAERWHKPLLAPAAPRERPQDSVAFSLDTPQEDEIGLAAMCPFTPYMGWAFPRRELHYRRYLSFEDATAAERAAFLDCLDLLIRKLASRDGSAVVLKSPGHTARIPMLLERWPDARFIVIHRHPYEVFRSSVHLYRTWWDRFAFLQAPSQEGFEARVLDLYETMHRRFFATEHLLPPDRTSTLAYDALVADPIGALRRVYDQIQLPHFPEDRVRAYLSTITGYTNNRYAPLEEVWRAQVRRRWASSFERWGYAP